MATAMRSVIGRAAGVALAAAGILVASPQAGASTPGWTVVDGEAVAGENFILNSVAAPAAGDVWAVGYHWEVFGGVLEFRTVAEHYDGFRFRIVPTQTAGGATEMFRDVSGTSSTDVWAVGTSSTYGASWSLIQHWDGSAWTIAPSANPGQFGNDLEGVAASSPTDVWAVGGRKDAFYQSPSAQHWDGTTWTAVDVPNLAGCTDHSYLTHVTALGSRNVWATGWCQNNGSGYEQGYVTHWNGTKWHIVAAAGAIPLDSELYGISAASTRNVWVVGYTRAGSALALHWDGTTWTQAPINAGQQPNTLLSVVARRKVAWGVGAGTSPQPPFAGPAIVRFANGSGKPNAAPVPFGTIRRHAADLVGRAHRALPVLRGARRDRSAAGPAGRSSGDRAQHRA